MVSSFVNMRRLPCLILPFRLLSAYEIVIRVVGDSLHPVSGTIGRVIKIILTWKTGDSSMKKLVTLFLGGFMCSSFSLTAQVRDSNDCVRRTMAALARLLVALPSYTPSPHLYTQIAAHHPSVPLLLDSLLVERRRVIPPPLLSVADSLGVSSR
jgi:hypothetical protein